MQPRELILRCYAERQHGQWVAVCLDFSLAAQDETLEGAKARLEAQIEEYVFDAIEGEDREHAEQLLTRRAPWQQWARYYFIKLLASFGLVQEGVRRLFLEIVPLRPYRPA